MTIGTIQTRKDGKLLVALRFGNEHQTLPTLRKIMTREQLETLKSKLENEAREACSN